MKKRTDTMEDPNVLGSQTRDGSYSNEGISSTDVTCLRNDSGLNDGQQQPDPQSSDVVDEVRVIARQMSNLSEGATSATSDVTSEAGTKKEKRKSAKYKTLISVFSKMKTGTVGKRNLTEVTPDLAERILRTQSQIKRMSGKTLKDNGHSNVTSMKAAQGSEESKSPSEELHNRSAKEAGGSHVTSEPSRHQGGPPGDVEHQGPSKRQAPQIPTGGRVVNGAQVTGQSPEGAQVDRKPLPKVSQKPLPNDGTLKKEIFNEELDSELVVRELESVIDEHERLTSSAHSDQRTIQQAGSGLTSFAYEPESGTAPSTQVSASRTYLGLPPQGKKRSSNTVSGETRQGDEKSEEGDNLVSKEGKDILKSEGTKGKPKLFFPLPLDAGQTETNHLETESSTSPDEPSSTKLPFDSDETLKPPKILSSHSPNYSEKVHQSSDQLLPSQSQSPQQQQEESLSCSNHVGVAPQRYCGDHSQAVCLECAFEFHRSCADVEGLQQAAVARRKELQRLCDRMLYRKAEWESLLGETKTYKTFMAEEKEKTMSTIKQITEELARAVQEKGAELAREAEKLFASEQERWSRREEEVKRALSMAQEAYSASDDVVMTSDDNNNVLLRQFGKLRGRCDAVMEIEISDVSEVLNRVEVKSKWLQELATNDVMELNAERSIPVKKIQPLSERSLETFRRISRKKRQALKSSTFEGKSGNSLLPPSRSGQRASLARSLASTGSLASLTASTPSMSFLDGPQSMFEFWAGLGSDKYPFGLGDMCILQPRGTILITYLTSDVLRGFPWRQVSPAFVSQPLGFTLCSITQLTTEIVAVTSSNSDQLSFVKVENNTINLMHTLSMKKQYRAVTSIDFRTLVLATDHRKSQNNVIVIVRFDSSDFRSWTHLRTINGRTGSFPRLRLLSRTLFKVPYSMCVTNSGYLVVSDSENKALLCLDQTGQTHFLFQPPKDSRVIDTPGGVACSPSGFLYLVDSCEQRILRFNPRGRLLKVVLSQEDGLEWPIAVGCADDSTLCVAEFYGQVKIFQIR